jgi:translation initiation factor 2D
MFKKHAVKVAKSHLLKSSDRRGIQQELQKQFPTIPSTDPVWEKILPARNKQVEIHCVKLQKPYQATLYTVDNVPLFFTDNEFSESDYYPTIFCLLLAPNLMPTLTIYTQVTSYVLSGADLMIPGISSKLNKHVNFLENEKVAIRVNGNPIPFSVGIALADANTLRTGTEGKGVRIMHIFGDNLWVYGLTHQPESSRVVPEGFTSKLIVPIITPGEESEQESEEESEQEETEREETEQEKKDKTSDLTVGKNDSDTKLTTAQTDSSEDQAKEATQPDQTTIDNTIEQKNETQSIMAEDMDILLEKAFMDTIKNHITDEELPLDIGALYTRMIMNSGGGNLDVKKSTYKKVTKFAKEMVKKKRIKIKEVRDVVQIVSVNRSHPDYKSHITTKISNQCAQSLLTIGSSVSSSGPKKVQILYFFKVPKLLLPIFSVEETHSADKLFTEKQIKQHLMQYLYKECQLPEQNNGNTKVNQFLFEQLFRTKKEEQDPVLEGSTVSIARLYKKLIEKLKPHYAIKFGNQNEDSLIIHKGECKGILIETDSVMGNKSVTKINGLKPFLVPIDDSNKKTVTLDCAEFWEFVKLVKTKASASVKTNTEADINKNECEVLVQGNVIPQISELLLNEYGIPKNLLIINDKLAKKKKKK